MKKFSIITITSFLLLLCACKSSNYVTIKEHWTLDEKGTHKQKTIKQYLPAGYLYMPEGAFTSECIYLHGYSGQIIESGPRINDRTYIWIDTFAAGIGKMHSNQFKFKQLPESVSTKKSSPDFFISQFEESNIQYKEYLYCLKSDSSHQSYINALPDTQVVDREHQMQFGEPYIGCLYFQHPAYQSCPVVGITHAQAEAYCRWKSIYVSKKVCEMEHIPFRKDSLIIVFRLPTLSEWEYASRYNQAYGKMYPNALNWKIDNTDQWYFRKERLESKKKVSDYSNTIYPGSVDLQQSRETSKLNNMSENVSEWLSPNEYFAHRGNVFTYTYQRDTSVYENEFIFAGGSFMYPEPSAKTFNAEYLKNISNYKPGYYDHVPIFVKATPKDRAFSTVGFRCVMEVRGKQ